MIAPHPRALTSLLALAALLPVAAPWASAEEEVAAEEEPHRPPTPEFDETVTTDQILARIALLASEEYQGRESGSPGGVRTERYVAGEFARFGLEFLSPQDGGRLTPVDLPARTPRPADSGIDVTLEGGKTTPFPGATGAVPFGFSAEGELTAGVVFAGYGLRSDSNEYNDYEDLDCEGKVVLVLRHGPRETDKESPWHGSNPAARRFLSFTAKAKRAWKAGAAAILMVNDYNHEQDGLPVGVGGETSKILVMACPREAADLILAPSGKTLKELQATIDKAMKPKSFELPGITVTLRAALGDSRAHNVVAFKRGTDETLAEEAVLVCAHMDHVGFGWSGSLSGERKIHNGADDNASGTAALLEVAEALAKAPPTRRSILFAAWCGEEKGLVGSRAYTSKPLWSLGKTVVCLNMDMVGRYRAGGKNQGLGVGGAPTGSGLTERVERLAAAEDLQITHGWDAWQQSDHFPFYRTGMPALFFTTGLHEDYHRPGDDWWKVEAEGAARIARMVAALAVELADADARPVFKEKPKRPILGVQLRGDDGIEGAIIGRVFPRFGAGRAGLKVGDVIVAIDGKPVKGPQDVGPLLGAHKPDTKADITYVRDGQKKTVPVLLIGV